MTPAGPAEVEAYLARIGHRGPRLPTQETLAALHLLHPRAIAFENLDPFLGRAPGTSQEALMAKLVRGRRGGWCFEHNLLFWRVLAALGFAVSGLAARVVWGRPAGSVSPRTHMLLRIDLDGGILLADVGFGGLTQTAPLRLVPGQVQQTPHEPFRIAADGDGYRAEALAGGEWRALYRFDLQPQFEVDYLAPSHFLATHPSSPFLSSLMVARALDGGRLALSGDRLTRRRADGTAEERRLATPDALLSALEEDFGIAVPEPGRLAAAARRAGLFAG